jgi:hypothetical protein
LIVAHINPTGVEKVYFYADSELMEALCLAAWPLIRRELRHLDRKLKKIAAESVRARQIEANSPNEPP